MTLKNAALLALVGTILMTVLLVWNFVFTFLNVLRDLVPAVALFSPIRESRQRREAGRSPSTWHIGCAMS